MTNLMNQTNYEELGKCCECKMYYKLNLMWYIPEYHSTMCEHCIDQEKQLDPMKLIDFSQINKE
jgi:hypothetical protein